MGNRKEAVDTMVGFSLSPCRRPRGNCAFGHVIALRVYRALDVRNGCCP